MTAGDGSVLGTTQIVDNGPSAERWCLTILGDGYRADEMPKYHQDVAQFVARLRATEPFNELFDAINVFRVDVRSTDSGADDPVACNGSGAAAATFFDASFCNQGIQRLLVVDQGLALQVAGEQVPEVDMTMVIVNSSVYGGSGGGVAVFSTEASALEIGLHEMGHSFFGLADEYPYYRGCDSGETDRNRYTGPEPEAENLTANPDAASIKWRNLIAPGTAMPTTTNADCARCDGQPAPASPGTVGAFEGAGYFHCGLFRPQFNCRMRDLGQPFCAVCRRRIATMLASFSSPIT